MNKDCNVKELTKIDCVGNEKLKEELIIFLHEQGHITTQEDELVVVDKKLSKSVMESFLKKTDRSKHKITFVDADSYVIAIPVEIADIGLDSCEFCGYTGYTELIAIHRRTHQAL